MAGTVLKHGRPVTGPEVDYGLLLSTNQIACVYDADYPTMIVYRVGIWAGVYSGSPVMRLGVGLVAGSGAGYPGDLIAYSGEIRPTVAKTSQAGGDDYYGNVTPFVWDGAQNRLALVAAVSGGTVAYSMRAAASITAANRNFYFRDISGNVPSDPIEGTAQYNGHMSMWVEAEANVKPNVPKSLTVSNALVPTFTAVFSDPNEILNNGVAYDKLTKTRIRVLEGTTVRWDYEYTNSTTEQSAKKSTRAYGGTFALKYLTTYTYKVSHRDINGLWSDEATATFTITPANTKPNTPTNLSPATSYVSSDLTPTLTSKFSDPQETLSTGQTWDYLAAYQIIVKRESDGATMWAPTAYTASTTERNTKTTTRDYAGTVLAYNTPYLYYIRHQDRGGLWSSYAVSEFSITSLSTVDMPSSPSGFETSTSNPGNITAVYRHGGGVAANAMEARLLSSSGSLIATSPVLTVTVANNGTLTMTWAQSGFASKVQNGNAYEIQVRARDTNNQWSPAWSPARAFWFNTAPNVPTNLSPSGGQASSVRPLLTALATDPDEEQSRPTVTAEIMNSGGSVLFTRAMVWSTANSRYEYQTTSTDLAGFASYQWRAYAFDGYLYSGNSSTASGASRSAVAAFVYANVPAVTITGPASPVATMTPAIVWTTPATQTKYRVRMYRPVDGVLVYDTGDVTSSSKTHTIQSQYWINELWNNSETFNVVVSITDASTLWGDSQTWPLTLSYPVPAGPDRLEAFRHTLEGTYGTNAILIEWPPTVIPSNEFAYTSVLRWELSGDERVISDQRIEMSRITNPGTTIFLDTEVTSKQWYRYGVLHVKYAGNDIIASEITYVDQMVEWDGLILHSPYDPEALHVALRYGPPGGTYDPRVSSSLRYRVQDPMGSNQRVAFFGGVGGNHDAGGTFGIATDATMTADDRLEALWRIIDAQDGGYDGRPHIVCWRDGRGGTRGRLYGIVPETQHGPSIGGTYTVDLGLKQVGFRLGFVAAS